MSSIKIGLYYLFDLLSWAIIIRSFMTWIPNVMSSDMGRSIYSFLSNVTEPIEAPVRNLTYRYTSGPVDFSPMITLLLLMLLKRLVFIIF